MYPCVLYVSWIGNYLLPQDHSLQESGINEFQENCKEIVTFHILFFTLRFIETGLFYRRQNEREVVANRISLSMSKNIYTFQWSIQHDKNENCENSEELYIDKNWRKDKKERKNLTVNVQKFLRISIIDQQENKN